VPFEYLIRLYSIITGPAQLSPRDQAALVAQLQVGLREDGQHEAARKDIAMLLGRLRDREDVTYRTRTDVDTIFASIDAVSRTPPPTATETTAATLDALSDIDLRVETDDHRVMDLLADPGWADALGAFFAKRWPEAVERFEALHARYPGEARVDTRLKEAQRQRDIAAWSERADTAAADGDWETVVSALENLIALDAEHPDPSLDGLDEMDPPDADPQRARIALDRLNEPPWRNRAVVVMCRTNIYTPHPGLAWRRRTTRGNKDHPATPFGRGHLFLSRAVSRWARNRGSGLGTGH
jgi:hypothetical protein